MKARQSRELTRKKKLQELYLLLSSRIEKTLTLFSEAIISFSKSKIEETEEYYKNIRELERESDSIHDDVISRLYSKETLFFSRSDRLYIITAMDDVIDSADSAVRRMRIYYPSPQPKLQSYFVYAAENVLSIGKKTQKMVNLFFKNFEKTKELIIDIEDLRREIREIEYEYKDKLFSLDIPARDYIQYERIIRKILKVVSMAKSLASGIRSLVFKYEY